MQQEQVPSVQFQKLLQHMIASSHSTSQSNSGESAASRKAASDNIYGPFYATAVLFVHLLQRKSSLAISEPINFELPQHSLDASNYLDGVMPALPCTGVLVLLVVSAAPITSTQKT